MESFASSVHLENRAKKTIHTHTHLIAHHDCGKY